MNDDRPSWNEDTGLLGRIDAVLLALVILLFV